jgi:hypothetical protein
MPVLQRQKWNMFKTGNNFIGYFLIVATCIPLVPAILVIIRRIYGKEPLNSLLVVCLLGFLEGFTRIAPSLNTENQSIIHSVFSLLLFGFLVRLFKTYLNGLLKYRLNLFLAAFLSSLITYGLVKGWGPGSFPLDTLLNGVLTGIIFLSLPSIVKAGHWQVFRSPLFWIALGTLFYLLLYLLLEWTGPWCWPPTLPLNPEKVLFLSMADLIRYLLYIVAVLAYRQEEVPEEG